MKSRLTLSFKLSIELNPGSEAETPKETLIRSATLPGRISMNTITLYGSTIVLLHGMDSVVLYNWRDNKGLQISARAHHQNPVPYLVDYACLHPTRPLLILVAKVAEIYFDRGLPSIEIMDIPSDLVPLDPTKPNYGWPDEQEYLTRAAFSYRDYFRYPMMMSLNPGNFVLRIVIRRKDLGTSAWETIFLSLDDWSIVYSSTHRFRDFAGPKLIAYSVWIESANKRF